MPVLSRRFDFSDKWPTLSAHVAQALGTTRLDPVNILVGKTEKSHLFTMKFGDPGWTPKMVPEP